MLLLSWLDSFTRLLGSSKASARRRKRLSRGTQPERLEDRVVLAAPIASGDSYTVRYDTLNTSAHSQPSVVANDFDMDFDTLTAVLDSDVAHGTLTLNSNGHFTYTPDAGYDGADSFTYKAFDGTRYNLHKLLPKESKLLVTFLREDGVTVAKWLFEEGVPGWTVIDF